MFVCVCVCDVQNEHLHNMVYIYHSIYHRSVVPSCSRFCSSLDSKNWIYISIKVSLTTTNEQQQVHLILYLLLFPLAVVRFEFFVISRRRPVPIILSSLARLAFYRALLNSTDTPQRHSFKNEPKNLHVKIAQNQPTVEVFVSVFFIVTIVMGCTDFTQRKLTKFVRARALCLTA